MGEVIAINQKRFFTLDDAKSLLPVVRRITRQAAIRAESLNNQLNAISDKEKRQVIEEDIYIVFKEWHRKIEKLGAEAKGMWLVDFDSGEGYYCWKYPEPEVVHFHGYEDGFQGRVKLH